MDTELSLRNLKASFNTREEVIQRLGNVAGIPTAIEVIDKISPSEHEAMMTVSINRAFEPFTESQSMLTGRIVDRFQSKGARTIGDILTLGKHRARSMQHFGPTSLQLTEDMLKTLGVAELWREKPTIDDVVMYCSTLDKVPYLALGTADDALLNDMSIADIINISPEELGIRLGLDPQNTCEHCHENVFIPDLAAVKQIHARALQFAERFVLAVARRS